MPCPGNEGREWQRATTSSKKTVCLPFGQMRNTRATPSPTSAFENPVVVRFLLCMSTWHVNVSQSESNSRQVSQIPWYILSSLERICRYPRLTRSQLIERKYQALSTSKSVMKEPTSALTLPPQPFDRFVHPKYPLAHLTDSYSLISIYHLPLDGGISAGAATSQGNYLQLQGASRTRLCFRKL